MKIFGHPWIESETFYLVATVDEIKETPANALLQIDAFSEQIELIHYCYKNHLNYAVTISDIKEAIFANNLGAKYLFCSKTLVKELMPIAQNYLFDTQIVVAIGDESELENLAKIGVDGVIIHKSK